MMSFHRFRHKLLKKAWGVRCLSADGLSSPSGAKPRRAIGRGEGEAHADALQRKVAGFNRFRLPRSAAVRLTTRQLGADRQRLEDDDLPDAGDCRVGPNIGPGLAHIARRQNLDDHNRLGERLALGLEAAADDRDVGDAKVLLRVDPRMTPAPVKTEQGAPLSMSARVIR